MKSFRFEPVRWATGTLTVVTALITANELVHVIPDAATPYLLGAEIVLAVLLGKVVRDRVTPTAAPRDDAGNPLVLASMRSSADPSTGAGGGPIGRHGMSSW
jgi:hypothetical protein